VGLKNEANVFLCFCRRASRSRLRLKARSLRKKRSKRRMMLTGGFSSCWMLRVSSMNRNFLLMTGNTFRNVWCGLAWFGVVWWMKRERVCSGSGV